MEDLARGGAGVAKAPDGRIVFIPLTVPGDRVLARMTKIEKRYCQAQLVEILAPSPDRVEPRCEVFGRCGGCDWQHVSYELQWRTKFNGVKEALVRAGIQAPGSWDAMPAEVRWNYRNRVKFHGKGGDVGFFGRRSRELVPVAKCDIADSLINQQLDSVRARGTLQKDPYSVELEVLSDGEIREGWHLKQGELGFRQVHDGQNLKLREWIAARLSPGRELLDLFGGEGNLSLGMSAKFTKIDCVDLSAPSRPPDRTPAHYRFHREDVGKWLERQSRGKAKPPREGKSAIFDPPRAGLGESLQVFAQAMGRLGVDEIVHVGCDVDAWTKDLLGWTRQGWMVVAAGVLDLFPQTRHVESLALLRKVESKL